VRHWEELINFINRNRGPKEPYILTSRFKFTLEEDKLDEEYLELYTNGQMTMDPICGQISYNCCLSNVFKLKLGHYAKIFWFKMKRATGKEIANHVIRPAKAIAAGHVKARCVQLLIIIHRLWNVLKRVGERRESRMVGKRMILVLM